MPLQNNCLNCKFFEQYKEFKEHGKCRRFPPSFIVDGIVDSEYTGKEILSHSAFPSVSDNDWCGEFALKTKQPEF